jgi:UDP:flavonoid glycosyltransferase YjiC (YdhE family)
MRILFSPHRDRQHLYPLVPLAWACRAAGHDVRIAAVPALADAIVHTGLPAVTVGADMPPPTSRDDAGTVMVYQHRRFPPDWPLHPDRLDAEQRAAVELLGRNSAAIAEYSVDGLIAFAESWRPDVVVHDTASFTGPVAAAALGVPNVRFLTGVGLRPMETRVAGTEPIPEFAALFERRGLKVRLPATTTIDPSPPSLRLPVPEPWQEVRYVPYNGPGVLPPWLNRAAGRPRVCVTWGLSVSRASKRLGPPALEPFRLAVEALAGLDAEIIVTTTPDQLEVLGGLPPGVRTVASLPLQLLLPQCALIVHQAGDGTALTAAAAGIAQLVVTRKPDTALTGSRLAAHGAAIHLRYQELERDPDAREVIRRAAETLLADSTYTMAAVRLREEIERQPTPAELVPALAAVSVSGG